MAKISAYIDREGNVRIHTGRRSEAALARRRVKRWQKYSKGGRFCVPRPASEWQPDAIDFIRPFPSGTKVTRRMIREEFRCGSDLAQQILHFLSDAGHIIRGVRGQASRRR